MMERLVKPAQKPANMALQQTAHLPPFGRSVGGPQMAARIVRWSIMIQFLADNIDQMDLALDQLSLRDRNFDRFALMLIDNVVELTLHKHAQDRGTENDMWARISSPRHDPKAVASALGQHFEAKVKLAKLTGMLTAEVADSVQYLHSFRNTVYHQGVRHERILHSIALFYFQIACSVVASYKPMYWSWGSGDKIPHRALKYIGRTRSADSQTTFAAAWARLGEVAASMGDALVADLHEDMKTTIDSADEQISFLAADAPEPRSRDQVVVYCQAWPFAFSDEGKKYAAQNGCAEAMVGGYVEWMVDHYSWPVKKDPIPSWRKRLASLDAEANKYIALKKYGDFMRQTEELRAQLQEAAAQLDARIQEQIDIARGK